MQLEYFLQGYIDTMITEFNDAYKVARILYIDKELKRLPNLHKGYYGSQPVVREYGSGGRTLKTYYLTGDKNVEYAKLADRRSELTSLKKMICSELKAVPSEYHVKLRACFKLRKEDWEKMRSQSNPKEIKGDLWYDDIHMRSRFEINTAIVLGSLGLEFKYEPEVIIGGRKKYPDFVVYLPEFEVCFIIECMGKVGDPVYDSDSDNKLKLLMNGGFIPYRDFLVLGGSSDYIPTKEWVMNAVISVVNSIASECVIPLTMEVKSGLSMRFELPPDIEQMLARNWG